MGISQQVQGSLTSNVVSTGGEQHEVHARPRCRYAMQGCGQQPQPGMAGAAAIGVSATGVGAAGCAWLNEARRMPACATCAPTMSTIEAAKANNRSWRFVEVIHGLLKNQSAKESNHCRQQLAPGVYKFCAKDDIFGTYCKTRGPESPLI
jgi:hypothetical protein